MERSRLVLLQHAVPLSNCLKALHQINLMHGDLKPENILRIEGRLVLADFGSMQR